MDKFKKSCTYIHLYIGATIVCLAMVFTHVCFNGGGVLSKWFFRDALDTGNDFFNCIPAVKGYGLGYWLVGLYPPLAKLFFLVLARIYSHNNVPLDITIRNSMTDPRMQQAAMVPFIVFILFTALIIVVIIAGMFKDGKQPVLLGASIIGTYSVLFAIERGNVIFLSFMFLVYFIAYYQSENKVLRETAFISLALSAGLKLYPAVFGVLLVYEKRWKEAARTIIYGILALLIPYFMTKNYLPANEAGNTVDSISEWAKGLFNAFFEARPMQQQIFFGGSIVVALMGMILVGIRSGKHWIKVFYAGVLALTCGIQFACPYTYVFLIPSLLLFLKEEQQKNLTNSVYFGLFCLLNLPLPIFEMVTLTGQAFVGEFKMWVLFVMMIVVTLIEFYTLRRGNK